MSRSEASPERHPLDPAPTPPGPRSDYELGTVPLTERKGWLSISAVWIVVGIDLSGALMGIQLAAGMPFWTAIGATVLGSFLLGLLAMACTYVGAASGLSSAMLSRVVFGPASGRLIALVMAVSSLGWFGVQTGFFAGNARSALEQVTGVSVPLPVLCVLGGALMMLTAMWGYRSIERLSVWAAPLLTVLILAGAGLALYRHGTGGLDEQVPSAFSFGGAVSLVMGIFVLGVVVAPDLARWARTPGQAMAAGFTGFFVGNSFIVIAAILLSRVMGGDDLMTIYFALGLGVVALVVLTLAQWTTNTNNLYSAALSLSAVFTRVGRRRLTVIGGAVAILAACLGIYDAFIPFISAMGILLAPYGGVYVAEYLGHRRTFTEADPRSAAAGVNRWAIASWLTGCAAAVMTTAPTDGLGLGLFTLTTIPTLDGLLVAFAVHLALTPIRRGRAGATEGTAA